jgi:hypothetical protein
MPQSTGRNLNNRDLAGRISSSRCIDINLAKFVHQSCGVYLAQSSHASVSDPTTARFDGYCHFCGELIHCNPPHSDQVVKVSWAFSHDLDDSLNISLADRKWLKESVHRARRRRRHEVSDKGRGKGRAPSSSSTTQSTDQASVHSKGRGKGRSSSSAASSSPPSPPKIEITVDDLITLINKSHVSEPVEEENERSAPPGNIFSRLFARS